jgi:hypothetical protein
MQDHNLKYIAQVFTSSVPPIPGNMGVASEFGIEHLADNLADNHDVERHEKIFEAQLREVLHLLPIIQSVTSHTGKDYFTTEEADRMFSFAVKIQKELGLHGKVHHETHRARILYSPWVAREIVKRHPEITLVADYSHYTCVAEANTHDSELAAAIKTINPFVRHVHARVGFEEGPQVPDPRGKRWQPYHQGFNSWWGEIYAQSKDRSDPVMSTTPEFGPPLYCWTTPFDDKPVADMWQVNHFVGHECTKLFASVVGEESAAKLLLPVPSTH